jgi:hypothetical protein
VDRDSSKRPVAFEHLADVGAASHANAKVGCLLLQVLCSANRCHGTGETRHERITDLVDESTAMSGHREISQQAIPSECIGPALVAELARTEC